jgi:hypothetical protein
VAGTCESGGESQGSVKCRDFLGWLVSQEGFCFKEVDDRNVIATAPFGPVFYRAYLKEKYSGQMLRKY